MRTLALLAILASPAVAQIDPPDAVDINPDPNVVEVNLVAAETTWEFIPGVPTTVYAYNGSIPGPTIRANVGNTVIVHFTNDLPETTTIHWHGVELPAAMDGSHISQLTVPPGGTFDYQFTVSRDSLYWYHPHVRTFDQVEKGLYGTLLVKNPTVEASLGLDQLEEHILVFDDVLLDANMQIVPAFSFTDPLENVLYQLNGREGNHLLLNGKLASTRTLHVANGTPLRFRAVNAANTTFCRIDVNDAVDGFTSQLWEIGTDGGRVETRYPRRATTSTAPTSTEHPQQVLLGPMGEGILLMPGERLDVAFTARGTDGQSFKLYQNDWFRGRHSASYDLNGTIVLGDDPLDGFYPNQQFLEIITDGPDPGGPDYEPPLNLATYPALPETVQGDLKVTFGHGNPDAAGNVTLFAQADFSTGTMVPLPAPKIDSFNAMDVNAGETWDWEVTNLTHGDHPFHIHGFFFELVRYDFFDSLNPQLETSFLPMRRFRKDTIRIPARLGAKGSSKTVARLRTTFSQDGRNVVAQGTTPTFDVNGNYTSGGWLFHCHVLEHSGKGMLSFYEVHNANSPYVLLGKELPGSTGKTSLTARGNLTPGAPVQLDVVNAKAGTQVVAIVGDSLASMPFLGGTIVPSFGELVPGFTDANGATTIDYAGWEAFPSGTTLYVQVAVLDPLGYVPYLGNLGPASEDAPPSPLASPTGTYANLRKGDVALSNALKFTTP